MQRDTVRIGRDRQKFHEELGLHIPDSAGREAWQRQRLFYVKNRDIGSAAGNFVQGHLVEGYIVDGRYDIEYVGLNNAKDNATLMKIGRLKKKQLKDIALGRKAKDEKVGIYRDLEEYEKELGLVKETASKGEDK